MKDLEKIITKELLRRVLPKEIESLSDNFSFTINEDYIEFSDDGEMQFEYCIYKFAFKCKEWAFNKGYTILTEFFNQTCVFSYIVSNKQSIEDYGHLVEDIKVLEYLFDNKTEVEAIIKSCECILKEQNNDTK